MPEPTPRLGLKKPFPGEESWGIPLRESFDTLDSDVETIEGAQAKVTAHAGSAPHSAPVNWANVQVGAGGIQLTASAGGGVMMSTLGGGSAGDIELLSDQSITIAANTAITIEAQGGELSFSDSGGTKTLTELSTINLSDYVGTVQITGSITMMGANSDSIAFRTQLDGDDYPRFLMMTDPENGWYFWNGTADPSGAGVPPNTPGAFNLYIRSENDPPEFVFTRNGVATPNSTLWSFSGDVGIETGTGGFIMASPNGTKYRLKVANDGTLSTEVVT